MQAAAFDETGTSFVSRIGDELGLGVLGAPTGDVEISGIPCGFPSSFFHILHLHSENWIFKAADRALGGTATQKREHSTGLSGSKQVCRAANLACFLNRYTVLCGFSPPVPTMDCDASPVWPPPCGPPICSIFRMTLCVNYAFYSSILMICFAEIAAAGSRLPQPNPLAKKCQHILLCAPPGLSFKKSQLR
jgi:hypothetical protein